MALGFGFNKQKVLASAEKAVQQGKLQNAIIEYEKVTREDPKDLTVLNTIGDLHARVGNNDKAAVYFKRVGDIYASEGFTVKAIAVYKKIAKLNPSSTESLTKLAELYTQQGLYNDARSQYLQVADAAMKSGNLEEGARIFQKILELDSDNTAMQTKLADLYIKLGRKDSARDIFLTAANTLYQRGALDAADEALKRVNSLDPNNLEALLLRGKIASDSGDSAAAISYLEKIPDLDSRPEALRALLNAQLFLGKFAEAEMIAKKMLTVHNDASGLTACAESLLKSGALEEALQLYDQYSDRLLANNQPQLIESLLGSMNRISENARALELLRGIFVKAGEHSHLNEINELLAHALVQAGELQRASALYKELSDLEPENPLHLQNYKQIQGRLGQDPTVRELSKEEGEQAFMVEELEQAAPALDQKYSAAISNAIKAALTEAELFESYNMPLKAIPPLEQVLPKAPRDAHLNQRLAALYSRSSRFQEAVHCCEILQSLYAEAGHNKQARQYADMAAKFRERITQAAASAAIEPPAPARPVYAPPPIQQAPVPPAPPQTPPPPAERAAFEVETFQVQPPPPPVQPAVTEFSLDVIPETPPSVDAQSAGVSAAHEIDLSDWESMASVEATPPQEAPPPPAPPPVQQQQQMSVEDLVEETQFYLSQSLWKEAGESLTRLQTADPNARQISALRQKLDDGMAASSAPAAATSGANVAEFSFDMSMLESTPAFEPEPPPPPPPPPPAPKPAAPVRPAPEAPKPEPVKAAPVVEPKPAPVEPKPAPVVEPKKPAAAADQAPPSKVANKDDAISDFVLDLDEALGDDFSFDESRTAKPAAPQVAPPPPPAPPAPAPAPASMSAPAPAPAKATAARPVTAVRKLAPLTASTPPPPPADASSTLSDLFEEFKDEVEENANAAEDPDTHYNLGVAFKEMGLLDEAIGELQKVCHAIEKGHPFTQVMQAYTWLAHCFLEKGAPEASVKWYEKALRVPSIDEESRLAVYYELGSAYEAAGNKRAALQNFNEVYSNNIDYRDVAERIKALKS